MYSPTSTKKVAGAIGGTIGGILLIILLLYLYSTWNRHQRRSRDVEDIIGWPRHHYQSSTPLDDDSPPHSGAGIRPFSYDHTGMTTATMGSSVPRASFQPTSGRESLGYPRYDGLGHLAPTPFVLPQTSYPEHHYSNLSPSATSSQASLPVQMGVAIPWQPPSHPVHPQANANANGAGSPADEEAMVRHLYSRNVPAPEISRIVEGMRVERERLADWKRRESVGSFSGGAMGQHVVLDASPPEYDFKREY
jgi:hypothetical protein